MKIKKLFFTEKFITDGTVGTYKKVWRKGWIILGDTILFSGSIAILFIIAIAMGW